VEDCVSQPTNEEQPTLPSAPQPAPAANPAPALDPAPAAKQSKRGLIFGSLAVVFLLAAGALGFLYLNAGQKVADQATEIQGLKGAVTAADAQKAELTTTKASLDETKASLAAAEKKVAELSGCREVVGAFIKGIDSNNDAASEAAVLSMLTKCDVDISSLS
jgi:hypothetical protein